jgi:hypothetical protein
MDEIRLLERLKEIEKLTKECIYDLGDKTKAKKDKDDLRVSDRNIDFGIPIRGFIKKYSKNLSGPKKFALLVAYFSKGELKKETLLDEIEKNWNKMKSQELLGMKFNTTYAVRAKENDWVEAKKHGVYSLRPLWKEIFEQ